MEKSPGKNISNNKDNIINLNKNIPLELKQRKRKYSLPLKSFKVSSPAESKIISIICDNIFEDVNIDQHNDPSMINLSTKINLKNIFEEKKNNDEENINKINIEKENIKIGNSKTFNSAEKSKNNILNEEGDDNDEFRSGVLNHKKSYIFNNILKLKMTKCPRLLEDQWKDENILLDYNIIDFTSKYILLFINIYNFSDG